MRAIASLVTLLLVGTTPRAGAETPVALTVRVYNASGIAGEELIAGSRAAGGILRDAGLTVNVRHCGAAGFPGVPEDTCQQPLTSSEIVVRIVNAPAFDATLHPDAYGVTYIRRATNRGQLATVFSDRIGHAAERGGIDRGTLLGLVMAHEIGHLLLGVAYHGEAGLMRAEWPDGLLARAVDWKFSTVEAARMHRALETNPVHF